MAAHDKLIEQLRESRSAWCELGDGLAVKFRRPLETEFPKFVSGVTVEHVVEYATDWRGFTEATFIGAAIGTSVPLPFSRELWGEYARDNVAVVVKVAEAIADSVRSFLERREGVAGNSAPSST